MKKKLLSRIMGLLVLGAMVSGAARAQSLFGFDEDAASAQLALEAEFDASLSAAEQEEWLRILSCDPHHVGSAEGRAVVDFVAARFQEWGYEVEDITRSA